jgi:hypothetical protein
VADPWCKAVWLCRVDDEWPCCDVEDDGMNASLRTNRKHGVFGSCDCTPSDWVPTLKFSNLLDWNRFFMGSSQGSNKLDVLKAYILSSFAKLTSSAGCSCFMNSCPPLRVKLLIAVHTCQS